MLSFCSFLATLTVAHAQGVAADRALRQDYRAMLGEVDEVFSALKDQLRLAENDPAWSRELLQRLEVLPQSSASTSGGRPLAFLSFGDNAPGTRTVLWVGGIHPDEMTPSLITWLTLRALIESNWRPPSGQRLIYVPFLNPDGLIDGHRRHGYPTRENGDGVDLNRNLYDRRYFGLGHGEAETEFLLDLMEQFRPEHVIIPHSTLFLLDLDGHSSDATTRWLQDISSLSGSDGGEMIPVQDHPVYGSPEQRDQWSIGRWITERAKEQVTISGLTFEFGGPYPYPAANDPQRARKISLRKHLGRYSANTHWAHTYFAQYRRAITAALLLP